MRYFVTLPSGRERVVDVVKDARGKELVLVDGEPVESDVVGASVRVDGRQFELWLEPQIDHVGGVRVQRDEWGVVANGRRFFAKVESERSRIKAAGKPATSGDGSVRSPMPGRVVRVLVGEGDVVAAGTPVAVVEAMKMENELAATGDGVVRKVHVAAGATVEGGALLVEIGPAAAG
jgi:biotin carboxyl carrier protein